MAETATIPVTPETDAPPAPVSIADHAAQFSKEAQATLATSDAEAPANETPAQAQQRRDKATGQYQQGKTRHRARSQQASPEDVPRIQGLTARAKAAEERAAALEAEVAKYKTPPVAAPTAAPAPPADPEPDVAQFDDYNKFVKQQARWEARQELADAHQRQQQAQQEAQWAQSWKQRIDTAKQAHADFEAVALSTPVPWQPGSVVDQFIREDDNGPEILYHLQSNPAERDSLGQMTVLQASKHLALLSQRLLSPSPAAAGSNGAAPGSAIRNLPPKPPTPLRTEAQRGSPSPPPTDGSLSIAEHARAFGPKR